jgi:CRP-like cAMP-binding protein
MTPSDSSFNADGPRAPQDLRRITLFKDLPEADLEYLYGRLIRRAVRARTNVAIGEDLKHQVGFVWSGRCRIAALAPGDIIVTFATLNAGDALGCGLAILRHVPGPSARAIADLDCVILHMAGEELLELARRSPPLNQALLVEISNAAVQNAMRIYELAVFDLRARLLSELARLSKHGETIKGRCVICPAPTQAIIAAQIGAGREAVTRHLRELAIEGVIEFRRGAIEIIDIERLRSVQRHWAQVMVAAHREP